MRLSQGIIFAVLIVIVALPCLGQTIFWTGTGNGVWTEPSNWNPQQVPTAQDTVEIGNLNTVTYTQSNQTIAKLRITGRATFNIDGPNARLDIIGSATEGLEMNLQATLNIDQGTLWITNTHTNAVTLDDRSTITNRDNLFISNYGLFGISITDNSTLNNHGLLNIDQLNLTQASTGIYALDGSLHNHSSGEMFVSTCNSLPTSRLDVALGFTYIDDGSSLYWKRNCN